MRNNNHFKATIVAIACAGSVLIVSKYSCITVRDENLRKSAERSHRSVINVSPIENLISTAAAGRDRSNEASSTATINSQKQILSSSQAITISSSSVKVRDYHVANYVSIAGTAPGSSPAPNTPIMPIVPKSPVSPTNPVKPKAPVAPVSPKAPLVNPAAPQLAPALGPVQPTPPKVAVPASPKTPMMPAVPRFAPALAPAQLSPLKVVYSTKPIAPASPMLPAVPRLAPALAPVQPTPKIVAGLSVKVVYKGLAWKGLANSASGLMLEQKGTVIGIPCGMNTTCSNVTTYNITSKDMSGINPKSPSPLQNASITQNATHTVMVFVMPLNKTALGPLNTLPLIWAYGTSNTLAYHGPNNSGGPVAVVLDYCTKTTENACDPACKPDDPKYDQVNVLVYNVLTGPILKVYSKNVNMTM